MPSATITGGPSTSSLTAQEPTQTCSNVESSTSTLINTTTSTSTTKSRKRKRRPPSTATPSISFPLHPPTWSYIHLSHSSPSTTSPEPLDAVTVHVHLQRALTRFLGTHGAAIPIDILDVRAREAWVRVPAEDRAAVVAAVAGGDGGGGVTGPDVGGGWWRVVGWSAWDARAGSGTGEGGGKGKGIGWELFED